MSTANKKMPRGFESFETVARVESQCVAESGLIDQIGFRQTVLEESPDALWEQRPADILRGVTTSRRTAWG